MSKKIPASEYMGYDKYIGDEYIVKKNPNMIEIPENATNGDVIRTLFPAIETTDFYMTVHATTKVESNGVKGSISYDFWKNWWNAPYKRMTREEAIKELSAEYLGDSERMIKAKKMAIAALKREQQFLDAGYKNQRVEFYIGGRKFMVKEMAQ